MPFKQTVPSKTPRTDEIQEAACKAAGNLRSEHSTTMLQLYSQSQDHLQQAYDLARLLEPKVSSLDTEVTCLRLILAQISDIAKVVSFDMEESEKFRSIIREIADKAIAS